MMQELARYWPALYGVGLVGLIAGLAWLHSYAAPHQGGRIFRSELERDEILRRRRQTGRWA